MQNDRRKDKNQRLRQLIVVGNLMELELAGLGARDKNAVLTEKDRERLNTLQEAWTTSLEAFRKHLHTVRLGPGALRHTKGDAA
jgi:hypothetical protein